MRLDQRIAREHALSRRKARDYVETGRVDVAGAVCREPGREVGDDARVALDVNRPAVGNVRTKLLVLREDPSLVVVDKPAGLLTLATEAREKDTLLARVNAYLQHRYRRRPYVGVVHRLDKDTSGAIVFARSREALRALQELFRRHDIEREYVAIVEGNVSRDSGTIGFDLVRDGGDRRRGTARPGEEGRRAVTHYRVLRRMPAATLVALRLETGRTHQIRVHLAAIGHPVVGDSVYRPRHLSGPPIEAARQMLHARTLGFRHPDSGERVIVSSEPPADFQECVAKVGRLPAPAASRSTDPRGRERPRHEGKAIESTERAGARRSPSSASRHPPSPGLRRDPPFPAGAKRIVTRRRNPPTPGSAKEDRRGRDLVAQSRAEVDHVGIDPSGSRSRPARKNPHGGSPQGGPEKKNGFPPKVRPGRSPGPPEPALRAGVEGRRRHRRRRDR
ncbi:MAG TPA: RluA family pseudouridine synthase [Thermoanaerobaculia bacterium]|nr:RluA family pseudouridine synthase [Thermoanaerobaculia bacterium]